MIVSATNTKDIIKGGQRIEASINLPTIQVHKSLITAISSQANA
jgi:hypothetical protein